MIEPIQAMPSFPGKMAFHRIPPMTAAITPSAIVPRMLMCCRPGTMRRARSPMMSPATM
jgi:hypothetical protein